MLVLKLAGSGRLVAILSRKPTVLDRASPNGWSDRPITVLPGGNEARHWSG